MFFFNFGNFFHLFQDYEPPDADDEDDANMDDIILLEDEESQQSLIKVNRDITVWNVDG